MKTQTPSKKRKVLITSALPYANGDLHLGHMLEHLITDFWARFQRMQGHECLAICADDTHGAPIMLEARKRGVTPEEQIAAIYSRHVRDFQDFLVEYDHYSSTHSPVNRQICDQIFLKLQTEGFFAQREVKQCYCEKDEMFLPDRFVKGRCPRCKAENQYGDVCEKCAAVYSPFEMEDPQCTFCGSRPVERTSEHTFFVLDKFRDYLQKWVPEHTPPTTASKLNEWLGAELKDWCLTRDKPYFGFEVPGRPGKYYYVWFDAPIGYIGSTAEWCAKNGHSLEDIWKNPEWEIYHNIGKDIVYFHCLFWPAILHAAGWQTPAQVFPHGMLTVNGEKFSKSRGTFINVRTYLNHLGPEPLRFYFASKLNNSIADLDLNWDDFLSRVNSELVGKITNLASRSAQMIHKNFAGLLGDLDPEGDKDLAAASDLCTVIAQYYEDRQFAKALGEIRGLVDNANRYFDERAPWKALKENPEKVRQVLTTTLNLFRLAAIYLTPILPVYSRKVARLFAEQPYTWKSLQEQKVNTLLQSWEPLMLRVEAKSIEGIVAEAKQ